MVELIQDLLKNNNCVIIPGFGAFIGNYQAAEVRLSEHKIYPPSKKIAFNRTLQANDGLLVNAVAGKNAITYIEAEAKVQSFVKETIDKLYVHKSLVFKDIGSFKLDAENSIQFHPYNSQNFLAESFGLKVMDIEPIQRLKEAVNENTKTILQPDFAASVESKNNVSSKVAYWMTSLIAILFIVSSLGWNLHKTSLNENQSSLVPSFKIEKQQPVSKEKRKTTIELSAEPDVKLQPAAVIQNNELTPAKEEIILPADEKPNPVISKSYIVIGAFFDDVHAERVKKDAESKGYTALVTKDTYNPIFRVSIESSNDSVSETLSRVKEDMNQRAWVYCVKCQL